MQDINSDERYSQFTAAVLDAAEREAAALICGAEKEKAVMLRSAAHSVAEAEYSKLKAKAERERMQAAAQAAQKSRKELLLYRESLTKRLQESVKSKCAEFVKSDAYFKFLSAKLAQHTNILNSKALVEVSFDDLAYVQELCRDYKAVSVSASRDIVVGGLRIIGENKIYDETLDTGILEEKESFLSYCNLKVV